MLICLTDDDENENSLFDCLKAYSKPSYIDYEIENGWKKATEMFKTP
jgi:hypothetical protein